MNNKIFDWRYLNLQTMDILLCVGTSRLSRAIQKFQRLVGADDQAARISHVAALYGSLANCLHVQESTTMNKWANKKGVQINFFGDWLRNYGGEVYVRKLKFDRHIDFLEEDRVFWDRHQHDEYESGIMGGLELLLCGLQLDRYVRKVFPSYNPLQTKSPHCSEIVAMRLSQHQMLDSDVITNRLPPWYWWKMIDYYFSESIGQPIRIK